ncbi:MAG: hypothetical protein WCA82_10775 [Jiangellales bacterium]
MQELIERYPLLLVTIPAIVVWGLLVVDVLSRSQMGLGRRLAWVVAMTVFFPLGLLWLLVRPSTGPAVARLRRPDLGDPGRRLLELVDAHERGDVDDTTFTTQIDQLMRVPAQPAGPR